MIAYLTLSVLPAGLLIAALNDIYEFKIPNWIPLIVISAYPAAGFAVGAAPHLIIEGLLIGAAALVIGFGLFAFRVIGGGDAKLLAASAPWLGSMAIGSFLLYTAIAGLALTIVMLTFRKLPILPVYAQAPWLLRLHDNKNVLPYGVAIAAGGLLSFSQTPFFQLAFGG